MSPLIPVVALLAMLICVGCGTPTVRRDGCTPAVGMTSAELVDCGCRPDQPRSASAGLLSDSLRDRNVTTVVSLRYLCHGPGVGFVWVSVTNGVAGAVYR